MIRLSERTLQQEVMLRLRAWPVVALPIPNGIWIPARNEAERSLVARIVARMKADGMLIAGAPDLVILWCGGAAMIELKRPASRDLLGNSKPAGRPSETQKEMARRCADLRIKHAYVTSWAELQARLTEWGVDR